MLAFFFEVSLLCVHAHFVQVIASLAYLVYFIDSYQKSWLRLAWGFDSELSFYYICGTFLRTYSSSYHNASQCMLMKTALFIMVVVLINSVVVCVLVHLNKETHTFVFP